VLHIDYDTLKALTRNCMTTNEKNKLMNMRHDDVDDNEKYDSSDLMNTQHTRRTKIMMLSHVRHLIIRFRKANTRITSQMLAPFDKLNVLHLIGTGLPAKMRIASNAFHSLGGTLTELGIDLSMCHGGGGVISQRLLCKKHLSELHNMRRIWLRANSLFKSGIERHVFAHMDDHLTHVDMHIKQISGFDDNDDGIITYENLFKFFMGTHKTSTNMNVFIDGSKMNKY
jgi:hypothetical protein